MALWDVDVKIPLRMTVDYDVYEPAWCLEDRLSSRSLRGGGQARVHLSKSEGTNH